MVQVEDLVAPAGDRGGRRRRKVLCEGGFATFASGGPGLARGGDKVFDLDHGYLGFAIFTTREVQDESL